MDLEGNILASHDGIENYTVGQRKHLKIATGKPLYVLKIIQKLIQSVVGEKV